MENVLHINNLCVDISKGKNKLNVVSDFSLSLKKGEVVGVIGESGCGKSITSLSIMGLLPNAAKVTNGEIVLNGRDISHLNTKEFRKIRGKEVAMIFQEPMTALNPLMTVGKQIEEMYLIHNSKDKSKAKSKTLQLMKKVGLSRVEELYHNFPHQLSGGMKQRIVIAIALINNPDLLIADEPTTALDVTIQNQILILLNELKEEFNTSVMIISHDIGVIKDISDKIVVMYAGKVVEHGEVSQVLKKPMHPYTKGLLMSTPTRDKKGEDLFNIKGFLPSLEKRTKKGCSFADRCEKATEKCFNDMPELLKIENRQVRCFYSDMV